MVKLSTLGKEACMKVLIRANQTISNKLVFHNTDSEESVQFIIADGFTGNEVDLSSDIEQARSYGK